MTPHSLAFLYRGPLASCNYGCAYCPFAKHKSDQAELDADREALARFVAWVARAPSLGVSRVGVLFTPWGEALVRRWYREAMQQLSVMPHVTRVAAQTNLSLGPSWLRACNLDTLALWTTFHPTEVPLEAFLSRCLALHAMGVRFSVGVVGLLEHLELAEQLRRALPSDVYLWINAYKRVENYYDPTSLARFERLDPLFGYNLTRHASAGEPCRAGSTVVTVDGHGTLRRCHFVPAPIGDLYSEAPFAGLQERPCPNTTCGCHIGYVHLDRLGLYPLFEDGVLERVPSRETLVRLRANARDS